jgi:hypothetical protein
MKNNTKSTKSTKSTINHAAQIAELTARRGALRAEIDRMPDHKHGTPWHTDRVEEIHAITRSIHAIEDAQMAGERKTSPVGEPPTVAEPEPLISVTLSEQVSQLVRWYCAITHHSPAEAVEGAVYGVFERAKGDYEHPGGDGFDWLMDDVLSTKFRDNGRAPSGRYLDYRTVNVDMDAAMLLCRYQEETGRDLRDIASAALVYALEMTFNPSAAKGGNYRAGEPWGYFDEEVAAAARRRLGLGEEAA